MAFPYKKMTEADIAYIRSVTSEDRVLVREEIPYEFHHDEMPEYGVYRPELYVEALDREEVSKILAYANRENIPVTARGAGTGLAGGATAMYGGILLSLMKMNRIFPVDHKNMTITAEPGALLMDIQEAAAAEGLFYPPDPGERTASIGGNVVTNAGGMTAVRYGVTRDFVRCLEVVMPDGKIMDFSSNVGKNTTGLDLKDLVVGSEGILCVVTQITLKLVTQPTHVCSAILPFATLDESADMVPKILALPYVPTTIEFLERELIDMIERHLHKVFPVREGEAVLFVKYEASGPEELDRMISALGEEALASGALDCCIADTPERAESVWSVRRAELEGMQAEAPALEEADIVVPRSRIAEYLKASKRIGLKHGLRVEPCGHVGDGNIHTELLRSPGQTDEEWKSATRAALKELYALAVELRGQMSGEHGTGSGRTEFLREFLGDDMIGLYRGIKRVFDPNWILNPGKMIALEPEEEK